MNEIYLMFAGLVPTRFEVGVGIVTSIIGAFIAHFVEWNEAIEVLVLLMVIDYITGVLASYLDKDSKLSSQKGVRGIIKKVVILLVISVAHMIDRTVGQTMVQIAVTWFFIGNEGLSILENAGRAGVPLPRKLVDALEQMKSEKKE